MLPLIWQQNLVPLSQRKHWSHICLDYMGLFAWLLKFSLDNRCTHPRHLRGRTRLNKLNDIREAAHINNMILCLSICLTVGPEKVHRSSVEMVPVIYSVFCLFVSHWKYRGKYHLSVEKHLFLPSLVHRCPMINKPFLELVISMYI